MGYKIRQAQMGDLDQLTALEERCFESDRISRRQYRYLIGAQTAWISVAAENGKVIGSLVLLFRSNSKKARIYSLSVSKEYRKQGIAVDLSIFCEKECRHRGCTEVYLEVKSDNERAISFYIKNGFEVFGKYPLYYADGQDAVRMRKRLL